MSGGAGGVDSEHGSRADVWAVRMECWGVQRRDNASRGFTENVAVRVIVGL